MGMSDLNGQDFTDLFPGSTTSEPTPEGVPEIDKTVETITMPMADSVPDVDAETTRADESTRVDEPGEPETPKASEKPNKAPEKKPVDINTLTKQHAALTRRQKALEKEEQRIISIQRAVEEKEAQLKTLEELDKLDAWELMQTVAGRKGMTLSDVIRQGIVKAAGHNAAGQEPEKKEPDLDPRVAKMVEEAQKRVDALENRLREKEAQEMAREDDAYLEGYVEQGLGLVDEEAYPFLTLEDPQWLKSTYLNYANQYAKAEGVPPDPAGLLEFINEERRAYWMDRNPRLQKVLGRSKPGPVGGTPSTPPAATQGVGSESQSKLARPKTITNQMAPDSNPGTNPGRSKLTPRQEIEGAAQWLKGRL